MGYQNTLVMEEDGEVVGVAIFYRGAKARELDEPLERADAKKSGHSDPLACSATDTTQRRAARGQRLLRLEMYPFA